jgi:uncharacterized protein YndB with AHSA1/START domain
VVVPWQGREKVHFFVPIWGIYERRIWNFERRRQKALKDLKKMTGKEARMNNDKFVYVIYLASTPETVWKALLDREMTRQYWSRENVSDWKAGSPWQHRRFDERRTVDLVGQVVESVAPRRLVLTWANAADAQDKTKHTRVALGIESVGEMVRLTVTHDGFKPGTDMRQKISNGWPRVLSSLKSFLETGNALDTWA